MAEEKKVLLETVPIADAMNEDIRVKRIQELLTRRPLIPVPFETLMGELHYARPYPHEECALLLLDLAWRPRNSGDGSLALTVSNKAWKMLCEKLFARRKSSYDGKELRDETEEVLCWILTRPQLLTALVSFFCEESNLYSRHSDREGEIAKDFLIRLVRCFWKQPFCRRLRREMESDAFLQQLYAYRPQGIQILVRHEYTHILLEDGVQQVVTEEDMKSLLNATLPSGTTLDPVQDGQDLQRISLDELLLGDSKAIRTYTWLGALRKSQASVRHRQKAKERLEREQETIRRLSPRIF